MFEKYWNRKLTGLVVVFFVLTSLCGWVYVITHNKVSVGYNEGYQPTQPIPFSHQLHAGQYQMDCRFCHTAVEESPHASVPSLNVCMNCHLNIKKQSEWLTQLRQAYEKGEPIQWKKVHLLPDFVRFNHSPHVKTLSQRNGLKGAESIRQSCRTCHGAVENMSVVMQKESLSMGWCIQCHRQEENKDWLTQCSTCHY